MLLFCLSISKYTFSTLGQSCSFMSGKIFVETYNGFQLTFCRRRKNQEKFYLISHCVETTVE